jgi:glycosyltransferase involved in cell wall biosynthesis
MRRVKPHIVQTWLPQMDVAAGVVALTQRIPWIVSERVTQPLPPSIKRRLRDAITSRATAVVSNSEEGLRAWQVRYPSMAHFHVPNAIALDEIDRIGAADLSRFRVTSRSRVVLAVGRLVLQKNMEALRAAMLLVTREIDAVALICGIGPLREVLLERIHRDELTDRVLLPGFVPEIAGWMKAADVLVSVSHFEGRPNAVIEAMACGTPLVVSDIPEHREILDSTSALLVDQTDPHDIANAILAVLHDSDAARARAAVACKAVKEWTPDAIAAEYARIYAKVARRD